MTANSIKKALCLKVASNFSRQYFEVCSYWSDHPNSGDTWLEKGVRRNWGRGVTSYILVVTVLAQDIGDDSTTPMRNIPE